MSEELKYPILPHLNNGIDFKKPVGDNPFACLQIIDIEPRYIDKNKMKLFKPPLRTTNCVLVKMNTKDYVVSSKPDGIFTALYIDGKGNGYYLYPKTRRLFKIGQMTNPMYFNVICNGELMEKNHYGDNIYPYLLLFDILEWGGNVLSNNLTERINICNNIIKYFKINPETKFFNTIAVKSYVPIKSIYRIISSKTPRKDGLIFTLKKGSPGKNCVRWKPFPTLTMGLEWDDEREDYRIYFRDIDNRKQVRKRYYDIETRSISLSKSNCSYFFMNLITRPFFKEVYLRENPNWDNTIYPTTILVELYVDIDPFFPASGVYLIKRFRYDKKYPDHVDEAADILDLMFQPVNLSEIGRASCRERV